MQEVYWGTTPVRESEEQDKEGSLDSAALRGAQEVADSPKLSHIETREWIFVLAPLLCLSLTRMERGPKLEGAASFREVLGRTQL